MSGYLTIAVKAAREAGKIIMRGLNRSRDHLNVQTKGLNDYVSEIDMQAEQAIIAILSKYYPQHAIMAEESGEHEGNDYLWIIDPLDGTTNYLHGFPIFSVSIALQYRGELTAAVIYNPRMDELFTAARGRGAFLNQSRIRVSTTVNLRSSLIGTGLPFRDFTHVDVYLRILRELMPETAGVRRAGSAAIDLAYLAAGRFDGFWEMALSPWDIAAGVLLIEEAGGMVSDFAGVPGFSESGNIVAGTPDIHKSLLAITNKYAGDI